MTKRLGDRHALVFGGGGSGEGWSNGSAAAVSYAREGAAVACIDISMASAEHTRDLILSEGGHAVAIQADVTQGESVAAAVERALAAFGRIDILHNNVGVTHMGGPVELDEATFARAIDINLGSVFRTTKAVLPHMIEAGGGAIVNISSLAAIRWTGYPYFAYYASKAAVNQATVAIAMQYAPYNIRANCIMPGAIDTPLIYKQISSQYSSVEEMVRQRSAAIPLGRMGDAFDIAAAAVFLASQEAKFITGISIPVDGGQSCLFGAPFAVADKELGHG